MCEINYSWVHINKQKASDVNCQFFSYFFIFVKWRWQFQKLGRKKIEAFFLIESMHWGVWYKLSFLVKFKAISL